MLYQRSPTVALESTVITHGLPRPQNLQLARDMERVVRENGATPATVAILDGKVHVGLTDAELERLANETNVRKISRRDFATAIVKKECGGTTVAGTVFAAHRDTRLRHGRDRRCSRGGDAGYLHRFAGIS
jgi:pseudouridine-5'-phosphate glycosidase